MMTFDDSLGDPRLARAAAAMSPAAADLHICKT